MSKAMYKGILSPTSSTSSSTTTGSALRAPTMRSERVSNEGKVKVRVSSKTSPGASQKLSGASKKKDATSAPMDCFAEQKAAMAEVPPYDRSSFEEFLTLNLNV